MKVFKDSNNNEVIATGFVDAVRQFFGGAVNFDKSPCVYITHKTKGEVRVSVYKETDRIGTFYGVQASKPTLHKVTLVDLDNELPVLQSFHTGLFGFERISDCLNLNECKYKTDRSAKLARAKFVRGDIEFKRYLR